MYEKRINHQDVAGLVESASNAPNKSICEIHDGNKQKTAVVVALR